MYSVYVENDLLYSPVLIEDGYIILSPKVCLEVNKVGSFSFLLPPQNPLYDRIQKLYSIVKVYDDQEEIFRGRVLHDDKNFYNQKEVYCEGELSFLLDAVDDTQFLNKNAQLIYDSLKHRLKIRSFGDYLKRYIYLKAGLSDPFCEIPLKEYQLIIRSSFSDNHTPASFSATTAKLSALSKNWLTQQTVKRNVVFLLGFGLNMSVDDVNMFLTKALREQEVNPKNPFEIICWYCYHKQYNYLKFEQLWQIYIDTPPNSLDMECIHSEQTIGVKNSMHSIHDDAALIVHLAKLKANKIRPSFQGKG